MTTKEREKLNSGLTQSNHDSRVFKGSNGYTQTTISENRTKIGDKTYYGFSDAEKAKKKHNG
ncbi:MAG: hypothetical protein QM737_09940 [Ferruginibacter sp.]